MNPFDLRGPEYLMFYAAVSVTTAFVVGVLRWRRELEMAGVGMPRLHDPYAIACLRDGQSEVLRVAVVSLVDRGLLRLVDDSVVVTPIGMETQVRKPVEQDLLKFCATPRKPKDLFASPAFSTAAEYETVLRQHRLLPDDDVTKARRTLFTGALIVLLFFSVTKIVIALGRGHTNIRYLVFMTIGAWILASAAAFPRRTARGRQFLAELRNLFQSLRLRAAAIRPGGANADLALAAAVFGMSALPYRDFGWVWNAFPKSGSSAGCGSSCGSSGCGGGGCGGGGCGGCGG